MNFSCPKVCNNRKNIYLCTPKSMGKSVSNDLGVWRSPVSAPALGAGGHKFESCYPDDQKKEVLSRAEFPFDASARSPFDKFSGCSAARLARQLRELEVPSSNLGIPTNFLSEPPLQVALFVSDHLALIRRTSTPFSSMPQTALHPQAVYKHPKYISQKNRSFFHSKIWKSRGGG